LVILMGIANLLADGLSMGLGDFISEKAEQDFIFEEKKREVWELENYPEGEKQEMEEIYVNKGINESDAKLLCDTLSKNSKAWVDVMMVEELGIIESDESPLKNGLITFGSFIVCGICPLLPYMIGVGTHTDVYTLFYASIAVTVAVLFLMGVVKTRVTGANPLISGLETMVLGCIAAGLAFLISWALTPLANSTCPNSTSTNSTAGN